MIGLLDRDQGAGRMVQANSKDPLQGIGGPMTRARAKQMKEALYGLVMEIQEKEAALEDSKASPRLITYLYIVNAEEQSLEPLNKADPRGDAI